MSRQEPQTGFTLIEMLIVVAIVGILAAIAVPNYSSFMIDGRRTDAITFLSEAAGEQIRYFSDNNQYADDMEELGYGDAATFDTPEGYYRVGVTTPADMSTFVLTATPVAGGKQAGDAECEAFTINDKGVRKNVGGTDTDCW
ncbi:type IV pilin protein [Granulosicoccus antarcticus]|uniref:Fimbrial protein n=1 Tax=Granulosicoccus antarcticus IMCC3135 TaxID=1192854 RepID=A0A2Z2P194_9GAMM|nr:type IV pilin protein [Granulosicoccus antarcticus]ASJ76555.1 Fimbrial protein [Granulosicoccus antarcticus IMCC3135]